MFSVYLNIQKRCHSNVKCLVKFKHSKALSFECFVKFKHSKALSFKFFFLLKHSKALSFECLVKLKGKFLINVKII